MMLERLRISYWISIPRFISNVWFGLGRTITVSRGDGAKMESSLWRKGAIGNPWILDSKVQGFLIEWWTVY